MRAYHVSNVNRRGEIPRARSNLVKKYLSFFIIPFVTGCITSPVVNTPVYVTPTPIYVQPNPIYIYPHYNAGVFYYGPLYPTYNNRFPYTMPPLIPQRPSFDGRYNDSGGHGFKK
jgi:hypothetical protein